MGIAQLGYIGIGASDLGAWEEFATGILGMPVSEKGADGSLYLRMDECHYRIAVHPNPADDLLYAGWETTDADELARLVKTLEAAGFSVAEESAREKAQRKVRGLFRVEDPNGIPLELFYGPAVGGSPVRLTRALSGFKTGDMGLGHIVLTAPNFERSIEFYRDLLGFRVSDYVQINRPGLGEMQLVFFHCNPRHHSLALGNMATGSKRISHFMVELGTLDDVGVTYDLCREKEIPIVMTLGRHTNDWMVSFYMQNPSGFNVEYGWNGRLVDDSQWTVRQYSAGSSWGHLRLTPR